MNRVLLLAAVCLAGCIVPAAPNQYTSCPSNSTCPPARRYDEVQHPIVNQDGRIEYLPDSVFRSWMFQLNSEKTPPPPDPN